MPVHPFTHNHRRHAIDPADFRVRDRYDNPNHPESDYDQPVTVADLDRLLAERNVKRNNKASDYTTYRLADDAYYAALNASTDDVYEEHIRKR